MINSLNLNYRMQKRFLLSTFLFIFAIVLAYILLNQTVAEQITQKAAEDITKEISEDYIKKLSKEIVDTEVWNRVKDLPIEKYSLIKLLQNIIAIQIIDRSIPNCKQYVLKVKISGMYPVLQTTYGGRPEIKDWIWLNVGEVWRYGATAFDEATRYPNGIFFKSKDKKTILTNKRLEYIIQFNGTMTEVLIEEQIKIFSYSLLLECIARVKAGGELLLKSPGNKMHK